MIQAAKNENETFWQSIPSKIDDIQVVVHNPVLNKSSVNLHEFTGEIFAGVSSDSYLLSVDVTISRDSVLKQHGEYLVSVKIPTELASSKQTFYTINGVINSLDKQVSGLKYDQGAYWLSNLYVGTDLNSLGKLINTMAWNCPSLANFWLNDG